jgi:hypothetical protein
VSLVASGQTTTEFVLGEEHVDLLLDFKLNLYKYGLHLKFLYINFIDIFILYK